MVEFYWGVGEENENNWVNFLLSNTEDIIRSSSVDKSQYEPLDHLCIFFPH